MNGFPAPTSSKATGEWTRNAIWIDLVGDLSGTGLDAGQWVQRDAVPEALRALLAEVGRVYAPFLLANADAVQRGAERVDCVIDGRRWVQGHMLEQGLARAYTLTGNRACAEALLASEGTARGQARGLWAEAAYQVRRVSRPGGLARFRTTFQLVEGRIARVGQGRGRVYLNFAAERARGPDRRPRRAFSVSILRGDQALLGAHARDPKALEGRRVRARGWIEERDGLAIDLSAGGLLELLDDERPGREKAEDARR